MLSYLSIQHPSSRENHVSESDHERQLTPGVANLICILDLLRVE